MRLTVEGIREATPRGRSAPTLADVGDEWTLIKGSSGRVNGASGWICLDNYGNPYDKAVPIVELTPDRHARFVEIAWPTGRPRRRTACRHRRKRRTRRPATGVTRPRTSVCR